MFLDVLFPVDVKKIIFVDADQVPPLRPTPPTLFFLENRRLQEISPKIVLPYLFFPFLVSLFLLFWKKLNIQVVRADLKELVEFDLEGAPYGYTPFCDSRKEMDGFRFWKSGYWASHLQGNGGDTW